MTDGFNFDDLLATNLTLLSKDKLEDIRHAASRRFYRARAEYHRTMGRVEPSILLATELADVQKGYRRDPAGKARAMMEAALMAEGTTKQVLQAMAAWI